MRYTTPEPAYDVEALFPFLKGTAKMSTRLHPRPANDLPPTASKLGGSIIWPQDEPVPVCPVHKCRAVPVLQLRKEDVPGFPFPPGTDLFQLLWFPEGYPEFAYFPKVLVFWREAAGISPASVLEPQYAEDNDGMYAVTECRISPEQVKEYPYIESLTQHQQEAISAWEQQVGDGYYQFYLSTCDANKLGGHPSWGGQSPQPPRLPGGQPPELLVQFSGDEWVGHGYDRWLPKEVVKIPVDNRVIEQSADGSITYRQREYSPEEQALMDAWNAEHSSDPHFAPIT